MLCTCVYRCAVSLNRTTEPCDGRKNCNDTCVCATIGDSCDPTQIPSQIPVLNPTAIPTLLPTS